MDYEERKTSRGIFFPLLLIMAGAILLLSTLGYLQASIWQLWPLIFIAAGLNSLFQREGFVGALIAIGLGGLFLLSNLGYLSAGTWELLSRYWPFFIIAAGLDILIGRKSVLSIFLSILVGLALLAAIFWFGFIAPYPGQSFSTEPVKVEWKHNPQAEINLENINGSIDLKGGAAPASLLEGNISRSSEQMPVQSFTTHGETAVFSLKSHSSDHIVIGPVANHRWQLSLNQSVPLRLNVKEIFGRQDLNLKSLKVENLNTETIFGDTSLTLPESGSMQGKVNSVFGSLIIHVPANTPVRLQIEHVFGGVTHPNDFIQEGKTFISPAAKTSSTPINLEVSGVFGSIIIQYLK